MLWSTNLSNHWESNKVLENTQAKNKVNLARTERFSILIDYSSHDCFQTNELNKVKRKGIELSTSYDLMIIFYFYLCEFQSLFVVQNKRNSLSGKLILTRLKTSGL